MPSFREIRPWLRAIAWQWLFFGPAICLFGLAFPVAHIVFGAPVRSGSGRLMTAGETVLFSLPFLFTGLLFAGLGAAILSNTREPPATPRP